MKKIVLTLMTGLFVTVGATAGEPTEPTQDLWTWFAGASVGYAANAEDASYAGHVGVEKENHALYLEVGYSTIETRFDEELDFIPVTLNYKYEDDLPLSFTDKLNWYLGGGIGINMIEKESGSSRSTNFMLQATAGLVYDVSESFELYTGVKYQWNDYSSDLDSDEFVYELGVRYNF